MNLRTLLMVGAGTIMAMGIASWLLNARTHAQSRATDPWQAGGPHKVLDDAARAATVDNEASIRALADAVFNFPHVYGRMPGPVETAVKNGLVQAEMQYLHGARAGVQERDLVALVNDMVDRLHLPGYAKTSANQIRVLRMSSALDSPVFMGRQMTSTGISVGDTVKTEMSPLQAVHVAAVLVNQKISNPDFQATPEEWDRDFHRKMIERLEKADAMKKSVQSGKGAVQLMARSNPRHDEMRQALSTAFASMTVDDGIALADEALRALKVT